MSSEFVVNFPTLGDLIDAWVEQHCRVPDGFSRGKPFKMADWQFWCTANHYRVREGIEFVPPAEASDIRPVLMNQAFVNRRSLIVAPQKTGKGPWSATLTSNEAVGPSLFAGWSKRGDTYECEANGCPCGWYFQYEAGEPMGMRHPSPLIQLTATSEDQVDNVYRPLTAMIRTGPLRELMAAREGFVRILGQNDDPNLDRIDVVTASAQARLGNPVSFVLHDEDGLYTKTNGLRRVADTQRRGAAGMGGRTIATTNCWDPAEESDAQVAWESQRPDIFKFYRQPPATLSYRNKVERARIHRYVYAGSHWVNLESIEAEAAELLERDPAQAERFFGNRIVQGKGSWLVEDRWENAARPNGQPADGTPICLGFDGSESDDWTVIRAETADGYQFTPTYGPDDRPTWWNPAEWGGQVPRGEVDVAVEELHRRFRVKRMYCDPKDWQTTIGAWALAHGTAVEWPTNQVTRTWAALERVVTDLGTGALTHDGDPMVAIHVANARKEAKAGQKYLLGKPAGAYHQKIDLAMGSVLAHEAAMDSLADGWSAAPELPHLAFGL